ALASASIEAERLAGSNAALPHCSHASVEDSSLSKGIVWARAPKARLPGRKQPRQLVPVMRVARSAVATHPGRKRRLNEDAFVCEPPLFAIADGMGGARAGEVASGLAAAALQENDVNGSGAERVVALMQVANRSVYERSSRDADVAGMGTTMTVALVEDGGITFGHVGDSRAYVLRDGELEQLTD